MAEYMLLILYDPTVPSDGSPSRQPEHARLTEEMKSKGHYISGAGLWPVESFVKRVRVGEDGERIVTDGPFAESREVLGGYFVVDCSDEEATAYARRISVDNRSWIEVRKVGIYAR